MIDQPLGPPTPFPLPAPAPASPKRPLPWASIIPTGAAVLMAFAMAFQHGSKPAPVPGPAPQPVSPLAEAVKLYMRTLPDAYFKARDDVTHGIVKTRAALFKDIQGHAASVAAAQEAASKPFFDASGNITDAAGLAAVLDATGKAMVAK